MLTHGGYQLIYIFEMAVGGGVADLAFGCDLAQGKAVDAVCVNKLNACFYKLIP
jgi:hypothetical protein